MINGAYAASKQARNGGGITAITQLPSPAAVDLCNYSDGLSILSHFSDLSPS